MDALRNLLLSCFLVLLVLYVAFSLILGRPMRAGNLIASIALLVARIGIFGILLVVLCIVNTVGLVVRMVGSPQRSSEHLAHYWERMADMVFQVHHYVFGRPR